MTATNPNQPRRMEATNPDWLACPATLPKATDPAHSTPAAPSAGRASTGAAAKPSDGQGRGAGDPPQRQGQRHPTTTKGGTQVPRQPDPTTRPDNPTRQLDPDKSFKSRRLRLDMKAPKPDGGSLFRQISINRAAQSLNTPFIKIARRNHSQDR